MMFNDQISRHMLKKTVCHVIPCLSLSLTPKLSVCMSVNSSHKWSCVLFLAPGRVCVCYVHSHMHRYTCWRTEYRCARHSGSGCLIHPVFPGWRQVRGGAHPSQPAPDPHPFISSSSGRLSLRTTAQRTGEYRSY